MIAWPLYCMAAIDIGIAESKQLQRLLDVSQSGPL